jgi:hypothetical protein
MEEALDAPEVTTLSTAGFRGHETMLAGPNPLIHDAASRTPRTCGILEFVGQMPHVTELIPPPCFFPPISPLFAGG